MEAVKYLHARKHDDFDEQWDKAVKILNHFQYTGFYFAAYYDAQLELNAFDVESHENIPVANVLDNIALRSAPFDKGFCPPRLDEKKLQKHCEATYKKDPDAFIKIKSAEEFFIEGISHLKKGLSVVFEISPFDYYPE